MRQKIALGVAICGFATAGLTLGAAFFSYKHETEEKQQALTVQVQDAKAQAQAAEESLTRLSKLQEQQQQHQAACAPNLAILADAEQKFATLRQEHGTFLQNIKDCSRPSNTTDQQNSCKAAICLGFDYMYKNSGESCANILLNRDNIVSTISSVRGSLVSDNCNPPSSSALTFMDY